MRFDLTDLRLFLHVVEAASITGGAERAGLALASASARIRGMEDALGTPLLERGRRGIRPTPAGRTLAEHARLVAGQVERMRGDMAAHARGLKARVRLLANTAAAGEFLPAPLAAWLAQHPHVDVELEERLSQDIVQAVVDGAADLGIVADWADAAGLETLPFRVDELVLVTAREHPLGRRRRVAFAELLDQDFVGLGRDSALQAHLGRHAARAGRPLRLRVRLSGFDAVCRMVAHSVGIAVVPRAAAERCRRAMLLRTVRLEDAWALRRLSLCARRFEALPAHARQLAAHLRAS